MPSSIWPCSRSGSDGAAAGKSVGCSATCRESRLRQTATHLGPPGYNTRYGYGLINAGRATDPAIPPARR